MSQIDFVVTPHSVFNQYPCFLRFSMGFLCSYLPSSIFPRCDQALLSMRTTQGTHRYQSSTKPSTVPLAFEAFPYKWRLHERLQEQRNIFRLWVGSYSYRLTDHLPKDVCVCPFCVIIFPKACGCVCDLCLYRRHVCVSVSVFPKMCVCVSVCLSVCICVCDRELHTAWT
jgi:hypothetical protein